MKILHVVESLEVGGLEHAVVALAGAQARRGHEVEIICLWRRGPLAERAEGLGLPVACCHKRQGPDLRAWRALRTLLQAGHADVVHTHNSMAHYYTVAALVGSGGVARLVNTRHGMGSTQLNARRERLYRLALRRTQAAISVCGAARERYVQHQVMPADKAMVVPNGIDLSRFVVRSAARGAQLRESLGLAPSAVVFGSVGRLHEAKCHALLLQALRRLLDAGRQAAVVLVGDGDQRPALEDLVKSLRLQDHVRLLGTRDDVPSLLAGMDVFVLPSRTEGYSLALLEACASALPLVATDVGGNGEIVREGMNGLLVPVDDATALATALQTLLDNETLRLTLGRQARNWVLREGSLDTMAERYLTLYQGRSPLRGRPLTAER